MKNMLKLTLSAAFLASSLSAAVANAELISKISDKFESTDAYWKQINMPAARFMSTPFYFNIPYTAFSPLRPELLNSRKATSPTAPILLNYHETSRAVSIDNPESQLGLRAIVVTETASRKVNSRELGESGLFETGDIVLSFRKEWFNTLRYSHIQLGVSHAGILYIEKGADGRKYLKNIDMPMDTETVADGFLSAKHYQEAPLLQIVRAHNLSPVQKENLNKWIVRLAKVGPAAFATKKIQFNKDYSAPKFKEGKSLKFVGDVGRIALGINNTEILTEYCSEFAWSVLSLRDCNMDDKDVIQSFKKDEAPSCIKEIFSPMPLLGSVTTEGSSNPNVTVGLIDGVPLITQTQAARYPDAKMRNELLDRLINIYVMLKADGNAKNISSSHRSVEEAALSADPKFYDFLLDYYKLVNDEGAAKNPGVLGLRQGLNASQPRNYSPTSFIVQSLLPENSPLKAIDYIGTIVYLSKSKGTDIYSKLRTLKVE